MKIRSKLICGILIIVMISSQLIACFDYSEINKITFATSIIFDIDDLDNILVYLDCVRPYRSENESSDKGRKIFFKAKGKSALEAIRKISTYSNNKLDFSQIRAYIFTENAALKGLDKYIDLINNDQQFGFKPYMFVYYGDIESILKPDSKDKEQDYLGLYIEQLQDVNKKNANVISANVNDYLTQSQNDIKNCIMGSITINEDVADKKIVLTGGTVFNNNKLVDRLNGNDALYFNMLNNKINQGTLTITNPKDSSELITLDIIKSKPVTDIAVSNDKIDVYKKINLNVSLGEIQGKLKIDDDMLDFMTLNEKILIEGYLNDFFEKYKQKNIDVLGVKRLIEEKYDSNIQDDYITNIDVHIEVNMNIEGSNLIRDRV